MLICFRVINSIDIRITCLNVTLRPLYLSNDIITKGWWERGFETVMQALEEVKGFHNLRCQTSITWEFNDNVRDVSSEF